MTVTYLLTEGEYSDHRAMGVLRAAAPLDWPARLAEYLAHQDAVDAAAESDWSQAGEEKFVDWLIAQGHLVPVEVQCHQVECQRPWDHPPYAPAHWPLCPCGRGRGEPVYEGQYDRKAGRYQREYRRCTACGHHFDEVTG